MLVSFSFEKTINQLDLALDQLALRDPDFDRFALMLVDNSVEITLRKHAWEAGVFNSKMSESGKAITKEYRDFCKTVTIAKSTGLISSETAESILFLHKMRNLSYHQGVAYAGVIHSMTIFYFKIACELLQQYRPEFTPNREKASYRAVRYLGDIPPHSTGKLDIDKYFGVAWTRLLNVANALDSDLLVDLAQDMSGMINNIDGMIGFLAERSDPKSRKEAIKQVHAGTEGQKYSRDPIPTWKQKYLIPLQKERNLHSAVKKYFTFMQQTEDLREKISDAHEILEMGLSQNAL